MEILTIVFLVVLLLLAFFAFKHLFVLPAQCDTDSPKKGNPKDPLTLFVLPHLKPSPVSLSPYAAKVETFLAMTNIPFIKKLGRPDHGPKGKVPWIEHGALRFGDSTFIIKYLVNTYGEGQATLGDIRLNLSEQEQAQSVLLHRLCEGPLFSIGLWSRFISERNKFRDTAFGKLPFVFRHVIFPLLCKAQYNALWAIGYIRHSPNDLKEIGLEDLKTLSVMLGDKPYFLGNEPTIIDCFCFGLLENLMCTPLEYLGLRNEALAKPNLKAYIERIKARYFKSE